ncbi:hypothetical protein V2J09_010693 [Rumex salicifolius]
MSAAVESSSSSSIQCGSPTPNNELHHMRNPHFDPFPPSSLASLAFVEEEGDEPLDSATDQEEEEHRERKRRRERNISESESEEEDQLSALALFVTAFRKSLIRCYNKGEGESEGCSWAKKMEIGLPSNVRHVAHVTFDRFNGFLGLPVEFEPEVPRRPPSASTTVFGVSTNSMQLSFDSRGNSIPTILLMMQRRLYTLGGLEVEGIFRITAGNDQEEYVRDQLNRGVIPDDADVHCLAGLIKAWFRELPTGLLDSLSPERLMESQSEEECVQLARTLPLTEASLLDWAINLMADIAQHENLNKMNPRNVAVVFAPNMTHVLDPLTALMHAVQVMNFLKTLIVRTLRDREDAVLDAPPPTNDPSDGTGPHTPLHTIPEWNKDDELSEESEGEGKGLGLLNSIENILCGDSSSSNNNSCSNKVSSDESDIARDNASSSGGTMKPRDHGKCTVGQLIKFGPEKGQRKGKSIEKNKGTNIVSRINARSERIEAWR